MRDWAVILSIAQKMQSGDMDMYIDGTYLIDGNWFESNLAMTINYLKDIGFNEDEAYEYTAILSGDIA